MSNALYDSGRQKFLEGSIAWLTDNIKCLLVRGYTPNLATHQTVADVTGAGGTVVAVTANLGTKTSAAGVADAADTVFSAVPAGAACQHVAIVKDNGGAQSTWPLIALIDTATGLPFTPTGADENVAWDNGANKIFKL